MKNESFATIACTLIMNINSSSEIKASKVKTSSFYYDLGDVTITGIYCLLIAINKFPINLPKAMMMSGNSY
ncbi:hypothetical protein G9F72_004735 [Clostridium estertheticum]|uniref:hypothetical protein n=1 Tax=Clostridium estertheticum TaxID=238834 RepID=UPI001CD05573|nr:hypothetical protein [Clostridium estertheticum]MBZ9685658.1 hypothetical protein [Clostridium estertheticum]